MTMPKKWFVLIAFVLLSSEVYGQVADSTYYKRLYYTSKVWGHVKYYHSNVAGGGVDWDDVLLESIPGIKIAPNNSSFNDSLIQMIQRAGQMESNSTSLPSVPDSLNNNSDISWIQDSIFSEAVQTSLETIKDRFRPQSNVYVQKEWKDGPPTFDTDAKYYEVSGYPDENLRILALFRYWNIIHYFFPYKNIMDQDWDTTLIEFIPKIVDAPDALAYHLAFREFTTRINDSHGNFSSQDFWTWHGTNYPPFLARYIENEMVITKVLPDTPVAPGDVIRKIDGENILELRERLRKYAHGSNDEIIERTINNYILWGPAGQFQITIFDGSEEKTFTLNRNSSNSSELSADDSPIWSSKMIKNNCSFGIVDMGRLEPSQVQSMFNDLWSTDAIIFDIRNYPNRTLWTIVNFLFRSSIHIVNFTVPDDNYSARLYWHSEYIGSGSPSPYSGKIIILFDERTQSQAEYTVMGLEQFPGAIKIGSTTSGADGDVSYIYLPGSISTRATFLGVYYPDYTPTQRVGIIPDIEVRPTIEGIRNKQDEVLNYALNCDLLNFNSETNEPETVHLYPNPSNDYLFYELLIDEPVGLEIYDILGRKLLTIHDADPSGTVDVSNLPSGIYFLKTIFENSSQIEKFSKIK